MQVQPKNENLNVPNFGAYLERISCHEIPEILGAKVGQYL